MNKTILLPACLLILLESHANVFPFPLGSAGQEYGKCAACAPDGAILFGMLFQNSIDFDPGPATAILGTPPGIDCAVVSMDPGGSLNWARAISGPATGLGSTTVITPHGIIADSSGNVIVIGYFGMSGSASQSTIDFDPGPGTANLTNTGGWDPFIWKLDPAGNLLWARTFGSTTPETATDERCWDVAVDAAGFIYVSGYLQGTRDLDAGPAVASFTSVGEKDHFLVKYDPAGNYIWGFTIPDTGDGAASLKENSLTVDSAGHVFLAGHFNGTADMDPGPGVSTLASAGNSDLFIARYDINGALQIAVRIGGAFNDTAPPGTLRCDDNQQLFMTGRFRGTIDLDPGPGIVNVANPGTTDNIWVAGFERDLAFRWGFSLASDNGLDGGHRVAFDHTGGLFVAGWYSGVTDFDGGPGTHTLTSRNHAVGAASDLFVAKYDRTNGAFRWARGFGGTVTDQTQLSINAGLAVDLEGNAYVTGQFYGTDAQAYDNLGVQTGSPSWTSQGANDGYLLKYDPAGNLWTPLNLRAAASAGGRPGLSWEAHPEVLLQRASTLQPPDWQDLPSSLGVGSLLDEPPFTPAYYRLVRP